MLNIMYFLLCNKTSNATWGLTLSQLDLDKTGSESESFRSEFEEQRISELS